MEVKIESLADISTPSTVSEPDITILPVIVPPAFINAPAELTFEASVTSADASIPSSFVPSADKSLPSTVSVPDIVMLALLITILPDIVPPAFGKAAFAVVVVEVKTPSLVAMSTPSTVPGTEIFPLLSS